MRNKILATTRDSIPYVKELRKLNHIKSVSAAILMQQMDYWFHRYPDGFYKFLQPCLNHPAYREGDSWVEELAFSPDEFRTAFNAIGKRHNSKTAWKEAVDCFDGLFYCSYHDKKEGVTWYFRNHSLVDRALDALHLEDSSNSVSTQPRTKPFPVNGDRQSTVNGDRQSTVNGDRQSIEMENANLHRSGLPSYRTIYRSTETTTENTNKRNSPLSPPGDASEPPPQVVTIEILEPESIRPSSPERVTDNQTTNQTEAVKAKDFGLGQLSAAPPPRTTKKYDTTEKFEALRNLYNEHKPPGWAVCKRLGSKRVKQLKVLHAELGEEMPQTLVDALTFVTNDDWWATRAFGIDTILRTGKAIEFAEKYEAQQVGGGSAAPVRRRQQQTFSAIEQALNGRPAGAFC